MVARSLFSRNSFRAITCSRYSRRRPFASDDVIRWPAAFRVKWPGALTWSSMAVEETIQIFPGKNITIYCSNFQVSSHQLTSLFLYFYWQTE